MMYGNPEVTAGGNALKFYSSVRVDIRRREILKDNQGIVAKVKVVKNKVAPPFRVAEFDVLFGSGVDTLGCVLDAAELYGIVERRGSWYSRGELRFAQGRRPAIEFLRSNADMASEIEKEVRKAMSEQKFQGSIAAGDGEETEGNDSEEEDEFMGEVEEDIQNEFDSFSTLAATPSVSASSEGNRNSEIGTGVSMGREQHKY